MVTLGVPMGPHGTLWECPPGMRPGNALPGRGYGSKLHNRIGKHRKEGVLLVSMLFFSLELLKTGASASKRELLLKFDAFSVARVVGNGIKSIEKEDFIEIRCFFRCPHSLNIG